MTLIRTVLIKGISTLVLLLIHATVFAQQVANIDEFNRAVAHAKPGDTIVLANGEWKDVELIFKGKGTEDKPITLTAQTPGECLLITFSSSLRIFTRHADCRMSGGLCMIP